MECSEYLIGGAHCIICTSRLAIKSGVTEEM